MLYSVYIEQPDGLREKYLYNKSKEKNQTQTQRIMN
jgi:hypothetical protein